MRVFVTGASGHLGSAIVPELIAAGHDVVGLARSDAAAATITAYGASVHRGDLTDLDGLAKAAADADGVIHLAFDHERMRSGDWAAAIAADLAVLHAFGDALAGTGKALVGTSGTLAVANLGRPGTEEDAGNPGGRTDAENAVIGFAERGVRSSVVRVPPITHSTLDRHGFARTLIAIARQTGVAGYPRDGANRWAAGHTLDVAHLYRLALEDAPAGTRWHAAGDEGIPVREIAQSIGVHLGLPAESIPEDRLQQHFGFLAAVIVLDNPTSTLTTRRILGWQPTHPGLLADFDHGDYFLQGREPVPPGRPSAATPTARQNAGTHSRPGAGTSSHTFTNPVDHDSASTAAPAASSTCPGAQHHHDEPAPPVREVVGGLVVATVRAPSRRSTRASSASPGVNPAVITTAPASARTPRARVT
jgi:nucleoside-diphosphate-sugar epimerase